MCVCVHALACAISDGDCRRAGRRWRPGTATSTARPSTRTRRWWARACAATWRAAAAASCSSRPRSGTTSTGRRCSGAPKGGRSLADSAGVSQQHVAHMSAGKAAGSSPACFEVSVGTRSVLVQDAQCADWQNQRARLQPPCHGAGARAAGSLWRSPSASWAAATSTCASCTGRTRTGPAPPRSTPR